MTDRRTHMMVAWLTIAALPLLLAATDPPRRAKPPKWPRDVLDVFFDDARDHLVGPRPAEKASSVADDRATEATDSSLAPGELSWADLISADALTTEIKHLHNGLTVVLRKPTAFRSGENLRCRRDFAMLSVLFDVVSQLEGEVSWQSSAALMRWKCSQAEVACRTGSDEGYAAAKHVHQQLDDLIRGQTPHEKLPPTAADARPLIDWTLLMQRMEQATEEKISPALAGAKEFRKASQEVAHQAQVLALLAQVIMRPQYEYGEDETFLEYATELRAAAHDLTDAADRRDYDAARGTAGRVTQSCSRCHEDYRG